MAPSVAERLLERLDRAGAAAGLCSLQAAAELGVDHQTLVGAVKSLQALGEVRAPGSGKPPGAPPPGDADDPGPGSR